MARATYTAEQKSEALQLLAAVGKAAASRETGIPAGTIASWGNRSGLIVADPERRREYVEVARLGWAERRATLANDLGYVAVEGVSLLLRRIEAGTIRDTALVTAIAHLIDRAQLLSGDATQRTEFVGRDIEAEALAVVDELAARRNAA